MRLQRHRQIFGVEGRHPDGSEVSLPNQLADLPITNLQLLEDSGHRVRDRNGRKRLFDGWQAVLLVRRSRGRGGKVSLCWSHGGRRFRRGGLARRSRRPRRGLRRFLRQTLKREVEPVFSRARFETNFCGHLRGHRGPIDARLEIRAIAGRLQCKGADLLRRARCRIECLARDDAGLHAAQVGGGQRARVVVIQIEPEDAIPRIRAF
jgi:hypothetical protein